MRGWTRAATVMVCAAIAVAATHLPTLADDDEDTPSILASVPSLAGLKRTRDALAEKGLRISGFYFSDPRANLDGGLREGATYSGLLKIKLDVDLETSAGVEGARLHADMLQIHGRDVSEDYVGNLLSPNDIGARPATRLFELYYEQEVGDRLTLRLGQMAADEEFKTSDHAELFIGASFGWAASPSENLPNEGPAYPLAQLGAQASWTATDDLTLVGAIYNGHAADPDAEDPQRANRHGLNFRLGDPPLVILEGRYRYAGGEDGGLAGALKLGGYAHFGRFEDLKYGTDGRVLGAPGSNGEPRRMDGTFNVYAIVDQQIWRKPGGEDEDEDGVGVFARTILGPADRNPINAYLDGGVVAKGLVPGRPDDRFGVGAIYANFSPKLADAGRAEALADNVDAPRRTYEAAIEATYKAQLIEGLTVQPTLQYVMRPNGGPRENGAARKIPSATIFGVTTVVRF